MHSHRHSASLLRQLRHTLVRPLIALTLCFSAASAGKCMLLTRIGSQRNSQSVSVPARGALRIKSVDHLNESVDSELKYLHSLMSNAKL